MKLTPDAGGKRFDFELVKAKEISAPTVEKQKLCCPNCGSKTAIATLRGDHIVQVRDRKETKNKLRPWALDDFKPQPGDVFQERLYCVRWVELDPEGKPTKKRFYAAPTSDDLAREAQVETLLSQNFKSWQADGFIPSMQIMPGEKTDEPIRTRGWTHWSHLFNPRQLLISGLLSSRAQSRELMSIMSRFFDFNNKSSYWTTERVQQLFTNQAINPTWNYGSRAFSHLLSLAYAKCKTSPIKTNFELNIKDARSVDVKADLWITDPPYADAVNYHELSEFFLAWHQPHLTRHFPTWGCDSKRNLAVKGADANFDKSMMDVYSNLRKNTPSNGLQVLMFTHQDPSVWAGLALIIWAAGLAR